MCQNFTTTDLRERQAERLQAADEAATAAHYANQGADTVRRALTSPDQPQTVAECLERLYAVCEQLDAAQALTLRRFNNLLRLQSQLP